jgi:thioredoxin-like negative regulator of GroEL
MARSNVRWPLRAAVAGVVVATLLACSGGTLPFGGGEDPVRKARALLQSGDLPGAAAEYDRLVRENPDSVDAAVGKAYVQVMAGDLPGADSTLAGIEPKAGDKAGEIKLRRALVALQARDLDKVKEFGAGSGLPEGELLAAEVHLVELDGDKALAVFSRLKDRGDAVGETAKTYADLVQSGDQHKATLAEANALWALGDRTNAVSSVEESLKGLPEDDASKASQILLWAGRAATSGKPDVTRRLLEDTFPPEGQQWRYQATRAVGLVAEGNVEEAKSIFDGLKAASDTPQDGLADALATACALTGPDVAKSLVEGMESAAAARCLLQAGAVDAAKQHAAAGPLKQFLEAQ